MSDEPSAQKFRQLAQRAEQQVKSFSDPVLKQRFIDLAAGWNRLADMIEDDLKKLTQ